MKEIPEIERRFLLRSRPNVQWSSIIDITQHYIQEGDLVKRLRFSADLIKPGERGEIEYIHKIMHSKGVFTEVHVDLPVDKYLETTHKAFKRLQKHRYVHKENGLKFEVDEIIGVHLILMEVELGDINQEINFPPDIEKEIIMEVTGMKELSNFALAKIIDYNKWQLTTSK